MKQENLNELRNIYLNIATGGEGPEFLSEAPKLNNGLTGLLGVPELGPSSSEIQKTFERGEKQRAQTKSNNATNQRAQLGVVKAGNKYIAKTDTTAYDTEKGSQAIMLANRLNKETGLGKPIKKAVVIPTKKDPIKTDPVIQRPVVTQRPTVTPAAAPRPAATTAPKSAASPTKPIGGDPMDQFARNFPKLAAKVKPGQSGYDTIQTRLNADNDKGTAVTSTPIKPTMQPSSSDNSGETDRLKKALDIKKSDVTSSYQWPSIKTIRDIADAYTSIYEKNNDGNLANNYPPYDKVTRGDVIAGATGNDEMGGKKKKTNKLKEATAMAKRGLDEPAIRNKIAAKTSASGAGKFADKATKLADRETYGNKEMKAGREKLARTQRGTFRDTTSSSPGLRGYGFKSNDPAVKAKQDARGNQRARAALTPNERKQLNMEFDLWVDGLLSEGYDLSNYTWNEVYEIYENATVLTEEEYEIYSLVLEHLLSNGYAETEHDANIIMENMSDKWVDVIIDEAYKGGPEFGMKYSKSKPLSGEKGDGSGYGPPEKFTKPDDKIEKPGTTVPPFKKGGYGRIMSNIPHGIGAHRDKIASKITTTTGGDPGAPTSQKMRTPDKKRLSREIVRKKPQA